MRKRNVSCWLMASFLWFGCSSGGQQGSSGAPGTSGAAATRGGAGTTGSAGATGVAGTGLAGTTGAAGAGGSSGSAGTTGAAGTIVDAGEDASADAGREAGADGAGDARPSCTTQGTELCEDFESGALDSKIWGMHVSKGTSVSVDGEHVHGGSKALHVKMVAGGQGTAQITDAVTFPAKNNMFYTRAYFYFSPDLPADDMGGFHMAYLLATGNNDLGFVEAGLGSAGNKQWLGYSEYYGAGPDVHAHGATFTEFGPDSPTMIVPQRWVCMELMQGGDATTTRRRIWIDGKELPEQVSNYSDRKPPQFSLMAIGVLQYHPTPLLTDVWVDDIRVSSARIGCEP
jgi:hypothetical protein